VVADISLKVAVAAAQRIGSATMPIGVDVTDEASFDAMINAAVAKHRRIDIVIQSAGPSDNFVPSIEKSFAHWQKLIDVNLSGTFLVACAAAHVMIPNQAGVILNFNSIAGVLGLPIRSAYSASKAGVAMLTRVLARE